MTTGTYTRRGKRMFRVPSRRGRPLAARTPRRPNVVVSERTYLRICDVADTWDVDLAVALEHMLGYGAAFHDSLGASQ